ACVPIFPYSRWARAVPGAPARARLSRHSQQASSIRAESRLSDGVRMFERGQQLASRGRVADPAGAVVAGRAKAPAVAAKLGGHHRAAVLGRPANLSTVRSIPDTRCAVRAGGQHTLAIRAEADLVDVALMPQRHADGFRRGDGPDIGKLVRS